MKKPVSQPIIAAVRFMQVELPQYVRLILQEMESAMRKINAVGIDVSKRKSMVTILRPGGELVAKPFEISHLSGDIHALANRVSKA